MTDTETRTDAEIRGLILKRLYELHSKSEWVDWDNFHELGLPQQEVGRYLKQLHDLGLAEGRFVASGEIEEYADIRVRIRARGADAVENPEKRPPEIVIDPTVYGAPHMTLDIGKLTAAIDSCAAALDEKMEAKLILQHLSGNRLLTSLLQKWFSGHLPG
jgi:hypothetical protein